MLSGKNTQTVRVKTSLGVYSVDMGDHHCGQGVTSLPFIQQAWVQIPVRSVSWFRSFPGFSFNCETNVRKFRPYLSLDTIWPLQSSKLFLIHLWTATVFCLSYSTWPSLHKNNKQQTYNIELMQC